jgi:hypothetical protein
MPSATSPVRQSTDTTAISLKQRIGKRMALKRTRAMRLGVIGFAAVTVGGQPVNVDLNSIRQVSANSLDFTYYLGSAPIYAQANCPGGYWVTFPERQTNRPQSAATQRMLSKVCSFLSTGASIQTAAPGVALVFDPPSNVRGTPNGNILCSVRTRQAINIYGREGQWYVTDYCGRRGYIHEGQIRF